MLVDKTGRNIHVGQLVDIFSNAMLTATVVDVKDSVIQRIGQPPQPKMIVVQCVIAIPADERGVLSGVYIVGDIGKKNMKELEDAMNAEGSEAPLDESEIPRKPLIEIVKN